MEPKLTFVYSSIFAFVFLYVIAIFCYSIHVSQELAGWGIFTIFLLPGELYWVLPALGATAVLSGLLGLVNYGFYRLSFLYNKNAYILYTLFLSNLFLLFIGTFLVVLNIIPTTAPIILLIIGAVIMNTLNLWFSAYENKNVPEIKVV